MGEAEKRLAPVAQDLAAHFGRRLAAIDGKAMVVGMDLRVCVALNRLIWVAADGHLRLRPERPHRGDPPGIIKVVITDSASDPLVWQPHVRTTPRRV